MGRETSNLMVKIQSKSPAIERFLGDQRYRIEMIGWDDYPCGTIELTCIWLPTVCWVGQSEYGSLGCGEGILSMCSGCVHEAELFFSTFCS